MSHLSLETSPGAQRTGPTSITLDVTPAAGIGEASGIGGWMDRLGQLDLFADEADAHDANGDAGPLQEAHPVCWAVPGAFSICASPDDTVDADAG